MHLGLFSNQWSISSSLAFQRSGPPTFFTVSRAVAHSALGWLISLMMWDPMPPAIQRNISPVMTAASVSKGVFVNGAEILGHWGGVIVYH